MGKLRRVHGAVNPLHDWHLERAFEERAAWLYYMPVDARFDVLRGEPRFQAMVVQLGMKEHS